MREETKKLWIAEGISVAKATMKASAKATKAAERAALAAERLEKEISKVRVGDD